MSALIKHGFLLVACACAWPGWLHPPLADTGGARRVMWKVEPDAELTRAARQIQQWHAGGAMPPDSHGLIASVALADYCAWYAPDERVFINSRFQHHRPELPEFVAVRGAVGIIDRPDEPPSRKDVAAVLKKHNAVFVALYNSRGQVGTRSIAQRERGGFGSVWDVFGWDDWATWFLDGRTVVIGWRPGADAAGVAGEQVDLDPVALAFGPTTPRIPAGRIVPARTPTWSDEFFRRPRPSSGYADEALGWVDYKQALRMRSTAVHLTGVLMRLNAPAAAGPPVYAAAEAAQDEFLIRTGRYAPPNLPDGSFHATPVLAVRAAFRAIAAEPDNPDGYFALAAALDDPDLPLTDGERAVGRIVALRRCLDRLPPPDQYRPGVANTSPTTAAETLARLYLGLTPDGRFGGVPLNLRPTPTGIAGLGRILPIDLALKTLERANEYAEVEFKNSAPETRANLRKVYDEQLKRLRDAVRERSAEYDRLRERARTVSGQYDAALQTGLIGEATRILQESGDLGKDFGPNSRAAAVQLAALLLCSGKLEEAAEALEVMRKESDAANANDPTVAGMRAWVRVLEYHVAVTSGNFPAAGAILESLEGPAVLNRPAFPLSRDTHGPVTPTVVPIPGANGPVGEMAWLLPGLEQSPVIGYLGMRTLIRNQLDREATYFHLRGMLALLEGDVPAARAFFLQSFRTPPAGWNMTEVYPVAALDYLQLIRLAELPPADRRALFRPKTR
ncbi:MAG: hypothetical protein K2P78_07840 [Gemmataceae bacterium]|nr:hypothetical protein [Gemmataceae bacterium]